MTKSEAIAIVRDAIPKDHVEFLESFDDSCRFGDYLFVHAGIRPGVEIDQQRQSDLRWIREPFLFDDTDHGFVVVHGHTIRPEVEDCGRTALASTPAPIGRACSPHLPSTAIKTGCWTLERRRREVRNASAEYNSTSE